MDKVKITQEQANAIEEIRARFKSGYEFDIEALGNTQISTCPGTSVVYNFVHGSRDNLQLYFTALVIGYEVEETPEDKVKSFYETASTNKSILLKHSSISYDEIELQNGIMRGIEGTLNRLNIKIEGIN